MKRDFGLFGSASFCRFAARRPLRGIPVVAEWIGRLTRSRTVVPLRWTVKLSRNSLGAKLFALTHALGLLTSGDGK